VSATNDPGGAQAYLMLLLAREYWRCAGKAEKARKAAEINWRAIADYEADLEKWQERMRVLKEQLGGEIPENITSSDYAERMELAPTEGD
jgi:hypothetical protein